MRALYVGCSMKTPDIAVALDQVTGHFRPSLPGGRLYPGGTPVLEVARYFSGFAQLRERRVTGRL